ncbi:MAG TPA: peptidase inhibitor family I36 protein [Vicinamibacteria bacterium]|nr:peptidase inhibitor family I36 protein [Vicinamibacteria bacterium]
MAKGTRILFLASGAMLATSTIVTGSEGEPRDGVCFYENADYRGDYFCARAGEDMGFLPPGWNDRISSIRLFGRAEVTVYRDGEYEGSSRRFDDDVRNLKDVGWNDRISSLRVGSTSHDRHHPGGYHGEDPDRIVRRAYRDILDREPDSAGLRLYRSHVIDDDWSEKQVRDALRTSPEYREKNTMTRPKAEDVVRRAYLSVLKREPDSGSRSYVDKVLRDNWTQADVERELRKSPEYRKANH